MSAIRVRMSLRLVKQDMQSLKRAALTQIMLTPVGQEAWAQRNFIHSLRLVRLVLSHSKLADLTVAHTDYPTQNSTICFHCGDVDRSGNS